MLEPGMLVDGKYKILSKIGQGGMSVVYLALNERANKTWAVKEIRKDGVEDFTPVQQGLLTEIEILKHLHHRYLPSIVDIIDGEDSFVIVMDYIQGKSLDKVLKERIERENRPLSVTEVISLGRQLCDVLEYLHTRECPVIYRDLKPANIMLKPDGDICLIDFGTARILKKGSSEDTTCLGTPGYAAPEQYGGSGQSGPQSDIYCLGATLHYLLTGRNPSAAPFHFPPITQCRPTLMEETPKEFRNILLGLEMLLCRCTQYEAEKRYKNCVQLKYDLEHAEELSLPFRRKIKRKLQIFFICVGLTVVLGGAAVAGKLLARRTMMTGYEYYIENASVATGEKKFQLYKKAIALSPQREEAWLNLLELADEDAVFTAEESSLILGLLNAREQGRFLDNKTLFQQNKGGYVRFAYAMGMLYYYGRGSGQDKKSAGGWFAVVSKANLAELDLKDDNEKKTAWQARANVLEKICSYTGKIGQINQAGDAQVSYGDYWRDLTGLLKAGIAERDNEITKLRLYDEIVYQICTNYVAFKESGISKEEIEQTLTYIEDEVQKRETEGNAVADNLKAEILSVAVLGKRQIEAAFSDAAQRRTKTIS